MQSATYSPSGGSEEDLEIVKRRLLLERVLAAGNHVFEDLSEKFGGPCENVVSPAGRVLALWVEMVDIAKELLSIVAWCSLGDEMLTSRLMKIAALLKRCVFCLVFSSSSVA